MFRVESKVELQTKNENSILHIIYILYEITSSGFNDYLDIKHHHEKSHDLSEFRLTKETTINYRLYIVQVRILLLSWDA